mmetsp:Transcript_12320/g.19112  ORF Transcript_12320/g.19112 Transcript_12320/m.19112 type:complete len:96 (-) Transcript_12320:1653-1940(-)
MREDLILVGGLPSKVVDVVVVAGGDYRVLPAVDPEVSETQEVDEMKLVILHSMMISLSVLSIKLGVVLISKMVSDLMAGFLSKHITSFGVGTTKA